MTLRERIESWVVAGSVSSAWAAAAWRRLRIIPAIDPDRLEFVSRQIEDGAHVIRVTKTTTYDITLDPGADGPDRVGVELVEP